MFRQRPGPTARTSLFGGRLDAASEGWRDTIVVPCTVVIGSHCSRQSLQVGEGGAIANAAIFAGIFSAEKGCLGVDHFENGGFTRGVAQLGEAQTFAGCS